MGGYKRYDPMITTIAKKVADGDKFLVEALRSEMYMALPVFPREVGNELLEIILREIAEAYSRGYKGRA